MLFGKSIRRELNFLPIGLKLRFQALFICIYFLIYTLIGILTLYWCPVTIWATYCHCQFTGFRSSEPHNWRRINRVQVLLRFLYNLYS